MFMNLPPTPLPNHRKAFRKNALFALLWVLAMGSGTGGSLLLSQAWAAEQKRNPAETALSPGASELIQKLKSTDEVTRLLAAKALGNMGPAARAALPLLNRLVQHDPDPDVRRVAKNAVAKIEAESVPTGTQADPVLPAMEKWVSSQGVVSLLKPAAWKVDEQYDGKGVTLDVYDAKGVAGVRLFVSGNDRGIRDALFLLGDDVKKSRQKNPDLVLNNAWATHDRSRVTADVSFTANGLPVSGRACYVVSPNRLMVIRYQAPADAFAGLKRMLLTILNNIVFYDAIAEQKKDLETKQLLERQTQPVQARMVARRAPDGSAALTAPNHWQFEAGKGRVIVGSEQEDAGFVFTGVESFAKDPGVRVPGVLITPYLSPDRFIGVFLTEFGKARNVQVIQKEHDPQTVQEGIRLLKTQCEAQDLAVRFTAKSGRTCLSVFKVITSHPAAFSGHWWANVGGFWAPEDRFVAYVPLLVSIADSYQINDAWVKSYIRSGIENLKRLQQKTQQEIRELHQARYDQQRSWEANQARRDYSNWKFSNYLRGETNWVSDLEGGKVYHTDTWGTKDSWTGDYHEGAPYNYVHFEGQNPRHPSLENMQEIDSFELYRKYIQGQ